MAPSSRPVLWQIRISHYSAGFVDRSAFGWLARIWREHRGRSDAAAIS